ncbi:MAG: response regulator transcription factor [Caldimonas sp.]
MLPLCLIISHDPHLIASIEREVEGCGLKPYQVRSFSLALGLIAQWRFDAVLVDADGFGEGLAHTLPELRDRARAPILMLSSGADEERQIAGLESGATDFIAMPASPRLIVAKLRRLIERAGDSDDDARSEVVLGPLRLDPRRAAASFGDAPLALAAGEFELLLLLASRPGEFVHRAAIARTLRRTGAGDGRRSADMHVCRIRRKLRDVGAIGLSLETIYGRGYSLCLAAPSAPARSRSSVDAGAVVCGVE